jgi:hypothetical protein
MSTAVSIPTGSPVGQAKRAKKNTTTVTLPTSNPFSSLLQPTKAEASAKVKAETPKSEVRRICVVILYSSIIEPIFLHFIVMPTRRASPSLDSSRTDQGCGEKGSTQEEGG